MRALLNQVNNDKKDRNKDNNQPFQNQAIHVLIKKLMPELSEKFHFKSTQTIGW